MSRPVLKLSMGHMGGNMPNERSRLPIPEVWNVTVFLLPQIVPAPQIICIVGNRLMHGDKTAFTIWLSSLACFHRSRSVMVRDLPAVAVVMVGGSQT
jgi:hypothetical protein